MLCLIPLVYAIGEFFYDFEGKDTIIYSKFKITKYKILSITENAKEIKTFITRHQPLLRS